MTFPVVENKVAIVTGAAMGMAEQLQSYLLKQEQRLL